MKLLRAPSASLRAGFALAAGLIVGAGYTWPNFAPEPGVVIWHLASLDEIRAEARRNGIDAVTAATWFGLAKRTGDGACEIMTPVPRGPRDDDTWAVVYHELLHCVDMHWHE